MSNSVTSCQNINLLPDAVLQNLLSFLPTKEAVATSILSKQWLSLWTWVPVLDFQDSPSCETDEKQRIAFRELVYSALILNRVVSLDKFRLNCDTIHGPSHINTWIGCAIQRFVLREVDISISSTRRSHYLKLRNPFFAIKHLKVLKLSNRILIDVRNNMSVCFPSLKILHLEFVVFVENESVSRLLQGCTVLEELLINRFFNNNVKNVIISVPTLKTLKIKQHLGKQDELEFASQGYELKINAPNLEYLDIFDVGSLVHLESVFVNLIEANICINGTGLFQLAKALCNAKFLFLHWIRCPDSIASLKDGYLPLFSNLILLQLGIGFDDWNVISHFLRRSGHNLKYLFINKFRVVRTNEPWRVPKGLSPYQTKVYSGGYEGDIELEIVEYKLEALTARKLLPKFSMPQKKYSSEFPR